MINKKLKIEKEESILVGVCKEDFYSLAKVERRLLAAKEFSVKKERECYTIFFMNEEYIIKINYRNDIKEIIKYFNRNQYFSLEDSNILDQANIGIEVVMKYKDDTLESFYLHLKILEAILPELRGVLDINSLQVLNKSWVKIACEAMTPPAPLSLLNFHGVIEEDESVWIHSHGLRRCGYREIEISNLSKENANEGFQILKDISRIILTSKSFEGLKEKDVFWEMNNIPCTFIKAVEKDESHSDLLELAFYESEENYKKGRTSSAAELTSLMKENPLFYFSENETRRMSLLAREREKYLLSVIGDEEYYPLIKFGIATDNPEEDGVFEHLWFEGISYNEKKYIAKLTNHPYFIKGLNKGDILTLNKKQMTDWLICSEECDITPDTAYILKEKLEERNKISIN